MLLWLLLFTHLASAETYDFYRAYATKGSFCSVVGGACAADPDFDGGFFQNPASLTAARESFDFDFDFNLDGKGNLEPGTNPYISAAQHSWMAAIANRWGRFAVGVSFDQQIYRVTTFGAYGGGILQSTVQARESSLNLPLSYRVSDRLFVGLTISAFHFTSATTADTELATIDTSQGPPAVAWSVGGIYLLQPGLYVGGWLRLPYSFHFAQSISGLGFNAQDDETIAFPLQLHSGVTWTPDGSRMTYLAQLDIIGETPGGNLSSFDALTRTLNQSPTAAKGRSLALDPRIGLRGPFSTTSSWNYYAGFYYESNRVQGTNGRPHATGGISYKLTLPYEFLDQLEFMAGADIAPEYSQLILTFR